MIYEETISEEIKIINNKIEQNKAKYNLDREAAKIWALSSGNIGNYEFLTNEDILLEKELLEKAAPIKRFEYSTLGSELKKQVNIAGKQYQELNKFYAFDK